jgi:hypothetical protein
VRGRAIGTGTSKPPCSQPDGRPTIRWCSGRVLFGTVADVHQQEHCALADAEAVACLPWRSYAARGSVRAPRRRTAGRTPATVSVRLATMKAQHPRVPPMTLGNKHILLVLAVMGISSAAIAQSTTQGTYARAGIKSKRPYHSCMVRLQSFGFSPHAAMTRCRMVSPGGFSR